MNAHTALLKRNDKANIWIPKIWNRIEDFLQQIEFTTVNNSR